MLSRYWLAAFQLAGIVFGLLAAVYLAHGLFSRRGLRVIRVTFGLVLFCALLAALLLIGRFFLFPLPVVATIGGSYFGLNFDEALGVVFLLNLILALLVLLYYTDRFLTIDLNRAVMRQRLKETGAFIARDPGTFSLLITQGLSAPDHGSWVLLLGALLGLLIPMLPDLVQWRRTAGKTSRLDSRSANSFDYRDNTPWYDTARPLASVSITRNAVLTLQSAITTIAATGLAMYAVIGLGQPIPLVLLHFAIILALLITVTVLVAVPIALARNVSRKDLQIFGFVFLVIGSVMEAVSPAAVLLNIRVY